MSDARNILSVDIDYAYSPTISEYDDFIKGSSITPEKQMEELKKLNLPLPLINFEKFNLLKRVVSTFVLPTAKIVIMPDHHQILDFLPGGRLSIYNIDHHHDIFYPGWHDREVLDEGNWVSHVKNLASYSWFRNLDSENLDSSVELNFDYAELYLDADTVFPKFDFLFCCFSSHWTGPDGEGYARELLEVLK